MNRKFRLALVGAAGLLFAFGCAKQDATSFLASAKDFMAKGDYPAAIIEIKNALQREPDNGNARLLLATSLLESGDAAGAEAEVRKAIAANAPDDQTYPLLARATGQRSQQLQVPAPGKILVERR